MLEHIFFLQLLPFSFYRTNKLSGIFSGTNILNYHENCAAALNVNHPCDVWRRPFVSCLVNDNLCVVRNFRSIWWCGFVLLYLLRVNEDMCRKNWRTDVRQFGTREKKKVLFARKLCEILFAILSWSKRKKQTVVCRKQAKKNKKAINTCEEILF